MTSAATINEPFLLSSYSVTPRISSKHQRNQSGIYASYQKPTAASDGFVSVAAQSNGVHVVDVSTLHPIISYTLGPSTSFTCAPLTKYQPSRNLYITFSAIASSPNIDPKHQGKTIWQWSENLSSPLTERSPSSSKQQHQSVVVPHIVSGLYDCGDLPSRILALSPAGDISLLTTDLKLKTTRKASGEGHAVLFTQVLARKLCSFVDSKADGAVVVFVTKDGPSIKVEVYYIDTEDAISSFAIHDVPLDGQEILTISCSSSGSLNIILRSGLWYSYTLTPSVVTPVSPPVRLNGLSFISPTPPPPSKQSQKKTSLPTQVSAPSLLALTSSHILLASQTPQNEIALLLWDSQYSVLLASYHLPIQSPLASQSVSIAISLLAPDSGVGSGNQQAILVLSQSPSELDGKTLVKSSIYAVPYIVPARSTLANAIGRGNAAQKWLGVSETVEKKSVSSQDAAREKLIVDMRTAVEQNRPQTANVLFKEWEKKEEEKMENQSTNSVMFGYSFVKDLLETVMQPQKPPSPLYSSEIVRYLIEKGVIRSAMLEGGLLASLRSRNDWSSIDLALRDIPDLSENELIETLSIVIDHKSTKDSNTMQVDSTPLVLDQTPSLPDFLKILLKHRQFIKPQLIIAFRHHLRSAETVTSVIELLDSWMKKVQSQDAKLMPGKKDIKRDGSGVLIIKEDAMKPKSTNDLPDINQILDFLQSLLDASFLLLLQHRPSHQVLKDLKAYIEPEITTLSQTEQLRGLVEVFARAHKKVLKDAEERKAIGNKDTGANIGKEGSNKDWRQRKREAHERAGMVVGVYSLEELVL